MSPCLLSSTATPFQLAILEKNEFYEEKLFPFQHDSWQNIVNDFKTLEEKS